MSCGDDEPGRRPPKAAIARQNRLRVSYEDPLQAGGYVFIYPFLLLLVNKRTSAACRTCSAAGQREDCTYVLANPGPSGEEAFGFCAGTTGLGGGGRKPPTTHRQGASDVAALVGAPNGEVITSCHVRRFATQTMLSSSANPPVGDAQVICTATVSPISRIGHARRPRGAEVAVRTVRAQLAAREGAHASLIHSEGTSRNAPGRLGVRQGGPPLRNLSPGLGKLRVRPTARDIFGQNRTLRVYDYWLGGKDNFAADRAAAEQVIATFPDVLVSVRAQRAFLARAVHYLVTEAGIRQFLDIGTGLPASNNTHEVAQQAAPGSRIVYVDNDPIVMRHAQVLLTSSPAWRDRLHRSGPARHPKRSWMRRPARWTSASRSR